MIKAIYHKDVYDKQKNKVIVCEVARHDDNREIQIFNLNNIKKVSFVRPAGILNGHLSF